MADFIQSANVKSASRTLTEPIADIATFYTIVQSVVTDNFLYISKLSAL